LNCITCLCPSFPNGRYLKWLWIASTLGAQPFFSIGGFASIGIAASLAMLANLQVGRRAAAYALLRPSRELLFTVLRREDKYKVKSITATLGYRTGDQLGAWSYGGLHGLGLDLNAISWIAVPVTAGWCVLSIWLARKQRALADAQIKRDQSSLVTDTAAAEPA